MKAEKTIRTPTGKWITAGQYVGLVAALSRRGAAKVCEHGHFECAAWAGGPCENEQAYASGQLQAEGER